MPTGTMAAAGSPGTTHRGAAKNWRLAQDGLATETVDADRSEGAS
jgi:hypothetical protein